MLKRLLSMCGVAPAKPAQRDDSVQIQRTPEEAEARRKAYKRRKAAKAARRRNRK